MPADNEIMVQYFIRTWKELSPSEKKEIKKQEADKLANFKWKKSPTDGSWIKLKARRRSR